MSFAADLPGAIKRAWLRFKRFLGGDVSSWAIERQFRHFFGSAFDRLENHEKSFPGFDLASVNRALASIQHECCAEFRAVGCLSWPNMRQFFDQCKVNIGTRAIKPASLIYQRVAIDVDEEASVVVNGLYLAVMKTGEQVAVHLRSGQSRYMAWDDMEGRQIPQQEVTIEIACQARAVADRFFKELEQRRQRLSIYRGKVIDPVLHGGVINSIGFRAIKRVPAEDLILPPSVQDLIRNSVLGFYEHRDLLQSLGIEMKRGILLHGPPGTGKTSICLHLAGLLPHFTICIVSGERLLYPREICRMARYLQPTMIVFEDIDLIALARDANGLATVLGELMNQIDGCEPTDQVLFMMNTNSLERLESAVRNRPGRVDQIIEVPVPDREARTRLIHRFSRNVQLDLGAGAMDRVLDSTDGMTPAMLKEIVKRAAVSAIDRNGVNGGPAVLVGEADLLLAAQQVQGMREPIAPGSLGFHRRRQS
jgi:energy-coupling factor transporter ATP-binding protein EcfA2